jgi:hypothetical protein
VSLSLLSIILSNGPDAVDQVRLSLEGYSADWFALVKHAGYAVGVGCLFEAPETIVIVKRWFKLRSRTGDGEETLNDKKSWFVPLAAVGLLIVVIGIVVETYAEGQVSDVDALLRSHASDKISQAESDAGTATTNAGIAIHKASELDKETQGLKTEAAKAKRDMVKAQLELAVINGPPYRIEVSVDGVAIPDLSKSNKQVIVLTRDTHIILPTFPKSKSLLWTLTLMQDDKGGHHFTFSPVITTFDPRVNVFPNTGWILNMQTDSNGSRQTTPLSGYIEATTNNTNK